MGGLASWDVLLKFVDKWCRWNDGYFSARVEKGAPELPQRIVDTVRRTGGWAAHLGMNQGSFPFQQKRFFEEYQAWVAVERVLPDLSKVLQLPPSRVLQLVKPITPTEEVREVKEAVGPAVIPRAPVPPPTPDQLRDRAAVMKRTAAERILSDPSKHSQKAVAWARTIIPTA
jgi:hypothetical protein